MTVTTTANSISYAGNGATKSFSFPYIFFEPSDLVVRLVVTATGAAVTPPPVLGGAATYDYTVSGVVTAGEYASGANVVFTTAPLAAWTVAIVREVPATQLVNLIDNTKFPAETINTEFDKLTVLAQQVSGDGSGPVGPAGGDLTATYPNPKIRPSATNLDVLQTVGGVATWAPVPAAPYPVMRLYNEQVLAATATEIKVTIPAGGKHIELEYHIANNVGADLLLGVQFMVGAAPSGATIYNTQSLFATGTTPSAQIVAAQQLFNLGTAQVFSGYFRPRPVGANGWFGTLEQYFIQAAGVRAMYTAAFDGSLAGVTGFRFVSSVGTVNFAVGSYVRCFVVM